MTEKITPLYDPVPETQIKEMLAAAFGKAVRLEKLRPTNGGLFNTSYYFETSSPHLKAVLRVAPSNQDVLVDFEKTMMSAEPVIYDLMRQAGVPVPAVLFIDISHKVAPRDYIILEYIDAVLMNDASVPEEAKPSLRRELGDYTRLIHSVQGERFGWPNRDGSIRGSASWEETLGGFIHDLCRLNRDHQVVQESDIALIERLWNAYSRLFRNGIQPCMVHNDLWEPNLLVKQGSDGWHIAAVLDGDRAMFADREFEFLLWGNDPDIMAGYGIPLDASPQGTLCRKWYMLSLALMNAYVYKVEYLDEENTRGTVQWMQNVLAEIRREG